MKKGFTLAELLITIVILAVLTAISVPIFTRSIEKAQANQAIAYLRLIRTGEKMYAARNGGDYVTCTGANATAARDALRNTLGVEVSIQNYTFNVVADNTKTPPEFTARAFNGTAVPAACGTDTICLDQDGTWTGSSCYKPTVVG